MRASQPTSKSPAQAARLDAGRPPASHRRRTAILASPPAAASRGTAATAGIHAGFEAGHPARLASAAILSAGWRPGRLSAAVLAAGLRTAPGAAPLAGAALPARFAAGCARRRQGGPGQLRARRIATIGTTGPRFARRAVSRGNARPADVGRPTAGMVFCPQMFV